MKKTLVLIALVIFLAILFLPLFSRQTREPSVFDDKCRAPCWRQITPGKTTVQEAYAVISSFPDNITANIRKMDPYDIFNAYYDFELASGTRVTIFFIDDMVVLINFSNEKGLASFEQCVEEFGTPEFAIQSSFRSFGLPIGPTHAQHIYFTVLSPQNGVVYGFDTYTYFGPKQFVSPESSVTSVSYFFINYYEVLLQNGWLLTAETGFGIEELHPWVGYGKIEELYLTK